MVDIAAETAEAEKSSSRRQDTASKRDLALCVAAFAAMLTLLISVDAVDLLFETTRHHEDWDLDEILVSLPALTFVMAWYSIRGRAARAPLRSERPPLRGATWLSSRGRSKHRGSGQATRR